MGVPGNANALLLRSAAAAGGYQISRSLRFNSSDSAYLSRTPASAGNRKTWTWAGWVKRSALGSAQTIFAAVQDGNNGTVLQFTAANEIQFFNYVGGAYAGRRITTAVYRDPSSWYHIVLVWDSANGTTANRIRLYVNGSEVTTFGTTGDPSSSDSIVNSTNAHYIGADIGFNNQYSNQYLADIHFINAQALTPSSFTEVSATTGQLVPKAYSGSYGTNGFKLTFSDNSNNTATTLGKDTSGNSPANNWTPTNFSVTNSTKNYTSMVTCGGGFRPGYPASNIFDFSLATAAETQAVEGVGSGVGVFTPSPSIAYTSSVEVYGGEVGQDQARINGGSWVSVNGGWLTLATGSGTINTIEWRDRRGDGTGGSIAAIRVDGVQLVDASNAQNDSLVDTPTSYGTGNSGGDVRGNYCTWNPLDKSGNATFSNGNLDAQTGASGYGTTRGTVGVSSGKWYWEITFNSTDASNDCYIGILDITGALANELGGNSKGYAYWAYNGNKYSNASFASYGASYAPGDVIGVALDLDTGTLVFYKNGSSQGTAYSSLSGTFCPAFSDSGGSNIGVIANFGQRPFAYTAPSGFKALCDTNLPAPVVAKPSTVMDVLLWSGTGGNRSFSSLNMSPDFVWIKQRNQAFSTGHQLYDIVRGAGSDKELNSAGTAAEGAGNIDQYGWLSSFDSNGFSVTAGPLGADYVNASGVTYVGWCWDAGSSTVTNTQGSITSSVRANASAGFSVATFNTGSSGVKTVGHGLNVAPSFFVIKSRSISGQWAIYHASLGYTQYMLLHSTSAAITDSGQWVASPTSSVFSFNSGYSTGANVDYVGYFWAPVTGYSSFGSYTGNGSADGPFVYTGFRPRFLLIKYSSGVNSWMMQDSARDTYNPCPLNLTANGSGAENDYKSSLPNDMLSNGFKLRNTNDAWNGSGGTYIYAAFAESPFQFSRAR